MIIKRLPKLLYSIHKQNENQENFTHVNHDDTKQGTI